MDKPIILSDADNTLWDTNTLFAEAQLQLLEEVEFLNRVRWTGEDRLQFVRKYDQELARRHHLHFRYPPIMLVFALSRGLAGASPDVAALEAISGTRSSKMPSLVDGEAVVANYQSSLSRTPPLLPTVVEGLHRAKESQTPVYVVTEGRIEKQQKILALYGLDATIEGVFEITKTVPGFKRLKLRFSPSKLIVIGDQPDRDISPAHLAGCTTVLVPSRFRPEWNRDEAWKEATYVAQDFSAAIDFALERN